MSNNQAVIKYGSVMGEFTPRSMPVRDSNAPVIDMNFNGINQVIRSNSDRISAISNSILQVNSTIGALPGSGNPTASIGLAAINGSAGTYMRSDAAPALSQAIVPTWTGVHTFSAKPIMSTLSVSSPVFTDGSKGLVSTGVVPVANGGTGDSTLGANEVLYGNGTGAIQSVPVNSTATTFFLTQTSSGAPEFDTLRVLDIPTLPLTKLSTILDQTILGNNTGGSSPPVALTASQTKIVLSLNNVENTALSTWTGSTNLTTVGTITTGTWAGTTISVSHGGTGSTSLTSNAVLYGNGTSAIHVLAVNASDGRAFLSQQSSGAPAWNFLDATDLPTITLTGDVSGSNTGGSIPTSIGVNKVADTMIRQSSGLSVIGRSANTTGNVADITGTDGQVLRVSGTALGFGTVAIAGGGTGFTSYALGDIIYSSATNTLAKLAGNTASTIKVLTQTGTGTVSAAPVWTTSSGTGNVVFSASPTLTGTISAAAMTLSSTLGVTGDLTISNGTGTGGRLSINSTDTGGLTYAIVSGGSSGGAFPTGSLTFRDTTNGVNRFLLSTSGANLPSLTASQAVFSDSSKNLVSNAITGSGNVVMSASPTLTGTITAAALTCSGTIITNNDLKIGTVGGVFFIKEGTNASMGVVTLVSGAATVNTTKVTANSRIFICPQSESGVSVSIANVSGRTAGTSFTITASSALDTSVYAWLIVEPA